MGVTKANDIVTAREENSNRLFLKLSCDRSNHDMRKQCRELTQALKDVKDPSTWNLSEVVVAFGTEGAQTGDCWS